MATTPILKANPLLLSFKHKQKEKNSFFLPLSSSVVRFTKLSASTDCSTNDTQLYNSRLLSLVNNKKSNTEKDIPTLVDVVYKKILMGIKVSIVTLLLGLGLSLVMFGRCNRVMAASCGRMGGFPSSSSSSWTSSSPSSSFSYNESQLYYSMWLNSQSSAGESKTSSSGSELSNEDASEEDLLYVFVSLLFVFASILFGFVLITLFHDTLEETSVYMHRQINRSLPIVQQIYGSPTSVLMIQVATSKGGHFLRRYLNQICESADTSTLNGLSKLFEETLISCFLYLEYWSSGCSFVCVGKNTQDAREFFKVLSNEIRRKSDEETLINVNNMKLKKKKSVRGERPYQFSIGYTMVTILVAVEVHKLPTINGKRDLEKALKKLLYIKNKIQGVEVLWTPQYDDEILSEKELHENYPFLRPLC